MPSKRNEYLLLPVLPLLLTGLWAAGCKKTPGSGVSTGQADAALISAGKTVFDTSGCMKCHTLGGQGGRRAPELTHIGADPQHTAAWIAAYVKNPKSQDPSSRMPPFGDTLNDKDLQAVGAYLASRK